MAEQLDPQGGQQLCKKIEQLGVNVHTSKNTKEIIASPAYNAQALNFLQSV